MVLPSKYRVFRLINRFIWWRCRIFHQQQIGLLIRKTAAWPNMMGNEWAWAEGTGNPGITIKIWTMMKGFPVNLPYKAKLLIKPKHLTLSCCHFGSGRCFAYLKTRCTGPGHDKHRQAPLGVVRGGRTTWWSVLCVRSWAAVMINPSYNNGIAHTSPN